MLVALLVMAILFGACASQEPAATAGSNVTGSVTETAQSASTSAAGTASPVPGAPADAASTAPGTTAGTASAAPATTADAISAASDTTLGGAGSGWYIELKGIREDRLWQSDYEAARQHGSHYVSKTGDKKGVPAQYRGLPLRMAIAMIDGNDATHAWMFDRELWAAGYDITLIAADGYSATFSTLDIEPDALIIADSEDGVAIAPMIVGDSPKNLWVKNLSSIETSLAPSMLAKAAADFMLDLDINGTTASFSLAELETLDFYMEASGAYTTSAGTRYEGVYGGIRLLDLLKVYTEVAADDKITFVAMDSYEMSYPGSRILDNTDGDWLLAFKLDGEYLPKDPGYIRTIKVGPQTPNIEGHLSVRMVKKIVLKQKEYVEFSLKLSGRKDWVLDRGTIQSCVSCHRQTVSFEQKGTVNEYTGFALWLLMGYVDHPQHAPHHQDKSIEAYDEQAALTGYSIDITAADGFMITLDSREVNRNNDIIIAMYKNGEKLPDNEAPLTLVWDRNAALVPAGAKSVRMIEAVGARF